MANKTITKQEIINRFIAKHGNKFDYSLMDYTRSDKKIIVICPKHGQFSILPNHHWRGIGCKQCGIESKIQKTTKSIDTFILQAQKIHHDRYDYSKTKYIHSNEYVNIECKIHGEFNILPQNHLIGYGCYECLKESKLPSIQESFIKNSETLHNHRYNYSKVNYKVNYEKIIITCLKHGDFEQTPANHLKGEGCPKCSAISSISKGEKEIVDYLKSLNQNIVENNRSVLNGKELDIYISEKQLAIEFDGLYWHNELMKTKQYHLQKTIKCENKGIQLIHIFEDEWNEKQEIVKSRLLNLLELNNQKIYARKCKIFEVSTENTRIFLEKNHIQGFVAGKYYYGLYYQNELVSLMTFGNLRTNLGTTSVENEYELLRFCNKLNISVVGGASKLFQYFIKLNQPKRIISYADKRWSKGKIYEILGFNFIRDSEINYFYVFGLKRKNRFNFRKDILISKYGCKENDTEHNFCFNQGWFRIYDCGTKVYEYINKK